MYNRGIESFLHAKKVPIGPAIRMFLTSQNATHINPKKGEQTSYYVNSNWNKFATFIDQKIKSGELKGTPVKLNHSFDEERRRNEIIKAEFASVDLSKDELKLIKLDMWDWSPIHSIINKAGYQLPPKDTSYTSKKLQNMPLIQLIKDEGLMGKCIEAIENQKQLKNETSSS